MMGRLLLQAAQTQSGDWVDSVSTNVYLRGN